MLEKRVEPLLWRQALRFRQQCQLGLFGNFRFHLGMVPRVKWLQLCNDCTYATKGSTTRTVQGNPLISWNIVPEAPRCCDTSAPLRYISP